MTSELKVDKITPASGTNTQIGEAGDTTNLSAGTVTLPTTIITGQSAKTSLADADKFLISDSAASGAFKYVESQYIGGGSLVYLGGVNASNHNASKVSLQQVFSSDYQRYKLMGAFQGTAAGASIEFRWLNSSNAELTNGNYHTIGQAQKSDSSSMASEEWLDWSATYSRMFIDTATGSHIHKFSYDLFPNQNDNVNYPTVVGNFYGWLHNSGGNKQYSGTWGSYWENTTSVAGGGIQMEATSGNFGTVNVAIWGYKDS